MVSLKKVVNSIYVLEMGYITVNQIPQILLGKRRFSPATVLETGQ